eukprot:Sdes_comp17304_c0_seq1m6509
MEYSTDEFQKEWDDFQAHFQSLEKSYKEYYDALEIFEEKKKHCMGEINRANKYISSMDKTMRKGLISRENVSLLSEYKKKLNNIKRYFPQPHSLALRIILGDVNLTLWNVGDRFKYKTEYERFKLKCTVLTIFWGFVNLFYPNRLTTSLYLFGMIYFYSILTTREHILQANGSAILTWWFIAHYLLLGINCVLLISQNDEFFSRFYFIFILYSIYSAVVALLQYKYQIARMYTLRALGKTDSMEITSDTLPAKTSVGWLLPFLFFGQIFQLYCGFFLFPFSSLQSSDWHTPSLSYMFILLGAGNIWYTLATLRTRS